MRKTYDVGSKDWEKRGTRWPIAVALGLIATAAAGFIGLKEYGYRNGDPVPTAPREPVYEVGDYYSDDTETENTNENVDDAEIIDNHNHENYTLGENEVYPWDVPTFNYLKFKPGSITGQMSGLIFDGTRDMIQSYPMAALDDRNKPLLNGYDLIHGDMHDNAAPIGTPGKVTNLGAHNNAQNDEGTKYMRNLADLDPEMLPRLFRDRLTMQPKGSDITYIYRLREIIPMDGWHEAVRGLPSGRAEFMPNPNPTQKDPRKEIPVMAGGSLLNSNSILTDNNPDMHFVGIYTCYKGSPFKGEGGGLAYDDTNINKDRVTLEKVNGLKIYAAYQQVGYIDGDGNEFSIAGSDDYVYSGLTECTDAFYLQSEQ